MVHLRFYHSGCTTGQLGDIFCEGQSTELEPLHHGEIREQLITDLSYSHARLSFHNQSVYDKVNSVVWYGVKRWENNPENLTIGGFARATGVNVETIRYYQRRRLLPKPDRTSGGIRRYNQEDVARMTFIKTAQGLGFSLNEIVELLRLDDGTHCAEASNLARHKLDDVRDKIANLRRIEKVLDELVSHCQVEGGNVTCPLITSLRAGLADVPHNDG